MSSAVISLDPIIYSSFEDQVTSTLFSMNGMDDTQALPSSDGRRPTNSNFAAEENSSSLSYYTRPYTSSAMSRGEPHNCFIGLSAYKPPKISKVKHRCPVCKRLYSRKDNLTAHFRIHSGERPYKCDGCAKTFRWLGTLRKHEKKTSCKMLNVNPPTAHVSASVVPTSEGATRQWPNDHFVSDSSIGGCASIPDTDTSTICELDDNTGKNTCLKEQNGVMDKVQAGFHGPLRQAEEIMERPTENGKKFDGAHGHHSGNKLQFSKSGEVEDTMETQSFDWGQLDGFSLNNERRRQEPLLDFFPPDMSTLGTDWLQLSGLHNK